MMTVVCYDVSTMDKNGAKRMRQVAKECQNYGQRVQNSVFEINADYATFLAIKLRLENIIDKDKDSLRIYYLGKNWQRRVEHIGAKSAYDSEGLLFV